MHKIDMIGLGLLGTALAHRFLSRGNRVMGFDLAKASRMSLVHSGGQEAASGLEVAEQCDVVVLSLPDADVVASVIDSLEPALRPGQLIIDTTTGEPAQTEVLAAKLAQNKVLFVDATIAGSSAQAAAGQVIVMAGGEQQAVEKARGILECFASHVFHVGPCGSGARMKLVVNLVLGLNRAVLAEALVLADSLELDRALALKILKSSPAFSKVMDTKGEKMLQGDFTPQARLSQHLKDVRLILAAAARTALELPLSNVHRRLLEQLETEGYGDLDNSAIVRAFGTKKTSRAETDGSNKHRES